MFHNGGAGFNPVAGIAIEEAIHILDFGLVDVAADDAIGSMSASLAHHGLFVIGDEADDVFYASLDVGREGPFGKTKAAADAVEESAHMDHQIIAIVAQDGEPRSILHNTIELVSVQDPETASVGGFVHGIGKNDDAAEGETGKLMKEFVMISGDAYHVRTLADFAQEFLNDIVVGLRPIPRAFEGPTIEDIANEIPVVGVVAFEKVEEL